jgi:hypothetical protein
MVAGAFERKGQGKSVFWNGDSIALPLLAFSAVFIAAVPSNNATR